jgi:hypothetical protein
MVRDLQYFAGLAFGRRLVETLRVGGAFQRKRYRC